MFSKTTVIAFSLISFMLGIFTAITAVIVVDAYSPIETYASVAGQAALDPPKAHANVLPVNVDSGDLDDRNFATQAALPNIEVVDPNNQATASSASTQWGSYLLSLAEGDATNSSNLQSTNENLDSLVSYLSSNPAHLDQAILAIIAEPHSEGRQFIIKAAMRLPDGDVDFIGEALANSSRPQDRIDGLSLIGLRDANVLPAIISRSLTLEKHPEVLATALQWAANVDDSDESIEVVQDAVEQLAFNSTDNTVKGEALTAMLYWDADNPQVLDHVGKLLTSPDIDERNLALYVMSTSQAAETGQSEYWRDLKTSLDDIVSDESSPIESRLQSLRVLRDLERANTPAPETSIDVDDIESVDAVDEVDEVENIDETQ